MSDRESLNPKGIISIDFEPLGRRVEVSSGTSLLDAARGAGVEIVSVCGGIGSCDSCRVQVVEGEVSSAELVERSLFGDDLDLGYRLACQAKALTDVKVDVPPESLATPQRIQLEGLAVESGDERILSWIDLPIDAPTLGDLRADAQRVIEALKEAKTKVDAIHFPVLEEISSRLREQKWEARFVLREGELVGILPPKAHPLGLAVDIGTTKLAGYLLDLESGSTLGMTGAMNPQIGFGEDVISRIAYTNDNEFGREKLQKLVVATINEMIVELCGDSEVSPERILEVVLVGNTAMHHLVAGLPVRQLAFAPYVPAVSEALNVTADQLGLKVGNGAWVHFPPNIAGFVGADHVAFILAANLAKTTQTTLAIDVGTNTEITLVSGGRMLCCSCASGPAFEGAHIRDGMRAAAGAIERVHIDESTVRTFTIGSVAPIGICGSGILDSIAELLSAGVLESKGTILDGHSAVRRGSQGDGREFLLTPADSTGHNRDIVITRSDVNEIQLAKSAIRSGIEILLKESGITAQEIEQVILAGAFGTYLDVASAMRVGMFPELPRSRYKQIGNAAGTGAREMLLSKDRREAVEDFLDRMEYIELTTHDDFEEIYLQNLFF